MSACFCLMSHYPLKKVFHKLGDSYQTYFNTYRTHTMATHHRGTGQSLERNPNPQEQDIDTPNDYQHEDMDDFENVEGENHTQLKDLTKALDHLQHKVDTTEGQPTEAIKCLECELHRLSLALHPLAPLEPLDEVLQKYTKTLCIAQKQTTFANTLLQDIMIFNGSDSSQLEDWLVDVETATNLTSESRT